MLSLPSRKSLARVASAAVACSVWLTNLSVPHEAQAATLQAPHVIAKFTTPRGEVVRFTALPDGSVGVDAGVPTSAAKQSVLGRKFSSPLELFRAVAPNAQAPQELLQASTSVPVRPAGQAKIDPGIKTDHAASKRGLMSPLDEGWFINANCNPPSSYNVCYAPAWGWAYLSASNIYYGHSIVAANSAPLLFTVNPVGQWWVPQGWTWYAWKYTSPNWFDWGYFDFYAGVSYAQSFDFEADVSW